MKLSLRNIGKVREADVEINGITVIAGENNTGKSTVGKVLFSVFNGFHEVKQQIKEEKIKSVVRIIYGNIGDFPSTELFKGGIFSDLAELIIDKVGKLKSSQEAFVMVPEVISQYNSKIKLSDFLEKDAERLFEVLSISDDEAFLKLLDSRIAEEFNEQPNNIYSDNSGKMILTIRDKDTEINLLNNHVQDISIMLELQTETVYIDDPFVVDEITPLYNRNRFSAALRLMSMPRLSYDHRNHLKENLLQEKQERNIFDEIVNNKKFDEIFTKIGLNHKGHSIQFPTSDHVFRSLSRRIKNKEEKKLDIRNLSTGMKTFLIIKTLLMNGTIQQNGTIILDEPEIHLHPEWQLIFAELIVLLQKEFNMHILLNTHSPYFLEAIEVYSEFHGIADKCKYYLAENIDENNSVITDTTDNTEPIYKKLARPFQKLENVRYSHD